MFHSLHDDIIQPPALVAPRSIDTDDTIPPTDDDTLRIAQLNCFNGKTILHDLLADESFSILILQEPWINPKTLKLPTHPAWNEFMPYDYTAKTFDERIRTGIYVSKRLPSWLITLLPSKSPLLTAIEINTPSSTLPKLRIIAAYNPPTHNSGLPVIKDWLANHNDRRIATLIGIDGNLHHPQWNPSNYRHTHTLAKELIRVCGSAGFRISSQKHIPTFYPRRRANTTSTRADPHPTTIDLMWINFELTKRKVTGATSSNNFGSDHQLLISTIDLGGAIPTQTHNTANIEKLAKASFHDDLEIQLSNFPIAIESSEDIDAGVKFLSNSITGAFLKQGKQVTTRNHRHKTWWDDKILGPILRERNRAR